MAESNTVKVLRALLTPAAALEAAFQQLLTERNVNTAVGAQLDAVGKLVGRARQGVADDEVYRRFIRATISANKSDGLIEDLLTIARLVVDDDDASFVFDNQGAAAYVLRVEDVAVSESTARVLIALLIKATAGGVRGVLGWTEEPPANVGRWTTQGTWGTALWGRVSSKEI